MEVVELALGDGGGRIKHQIPEALILREGDHLADVLFVRVEHDQAVDAGGDAAMGWRAVLEGAQETAELRLQLLLLHVEQAEDALLQLAPGDADAAAAEFKTVRDKIVLLRPDLARVAVHQRDVLLEWHHEGVVDGVPAP